MVSLRGRLSKGGKTLVAVAIVSAGRKQEKSRGDREKNRTIARSGDKYKLQGLLTASGEGKWWDGGVNRISVRSPDRSGNWILGSLNFGMKRVATWLGL